MFYATVINERTLNMIAKKNDGVQPSIEAAKDWFVWNTEPDGFNEILSSRDFHKKYRTPFNIVPHYSQWSEVRPK
jgi:hypothetical protein